MFCAHFGGGESYVVIPPLSISNPVSFEFWIKLGQLQPQWTRVFDFSDGLFIRRVTIALGENALNAPNEVATPDPYHLYIKVEDHNPSNLYAETPDEDLVRFYSASSTSITGFIEVGRWYHAVTVIGAAGDLHFYLTDGTTGAHAQIIDGSRPDLWPRAQNVTIVPGPRNYCYVGRTSPGDPSGLWSLTNVDLAGFRVWPVALSAGEVRALAEGGSIGRQPLVHLPFDDPAGFKVARDASGNGRDGTIVGSVVTGNGGSCVHYPATNGGLLNAVTIANPAVPTCSAYFGGESYVSLPSFTIGNPISFEFWFNLGRLQAQWTRFFDLSNGWYPRESARTVFIIFNNNEIYFGVKNDYSYLVDDPDYGFHVKLNPNNVDRATGPFSLNRWYHAVTVIGAAGDVHFYLTDGASGSHTHFYSETGLQQLMAVNIEPGTLPFNYVGRTAPGDPGGVLALKDASLAGFRVWSAALSSSEVQTLAAGRDIGRQPLVHLPFDDAPGPGVRVARDASGNGRDGTVVGSVSTGSGGSCTPYSGASSLPGFRFSRRRPRRSN
eukprot:tig00000113_g5621.t1